MRVLWCFAAAVVGLIPGSARAVFVDNGCGDPYYYCGYGTCGWVMGDTCEIDCGSCPSGQACVGNYCSAPCTPTTSCASQGMSCGSLWDGCAYQTCGYCGGGYVCNPSNVCQAPPDGEKLCWGGRASSVETPNLFDMSCGVGAANGGIALNWQGQWFSVYPDGAGWSLQNASANAYALGVAPSDSSDESYNDSLTDDDFDARSERVYTHATMNLTWRTRHYSLDVNGRHYEIEIKQRIYDHRVDAYGLQMRGDITFTITSPDPSDGQPWTIVVTPKRVPLNWDAASIEPTVQDAEAAGQSAVGSESTLFGSRTVIYDSNVELVSAVKRPGYRATDVAATAHPALNNAIDRMMAGVSNVYSQYEPNAVNQWGNLAGTYGAGIVSFDKQRYAQFFMQTRSSSGFSNPGQDRPLLDTATKTWSFHQPIVSYTAYWPFLAGICGLQATANSFLDGSFQAGTNQCFDGLPTSAYTRGSISFALGAAGGFGCDILVASASAGLSANINETFEFGTDLQALPPAVNAYVNLYSSLQFDAYFKTRVLFWRHRWQKTVGKTTVFQRSVSYQLVSKAPGEDLCSSWTGDDPDQDDEFDPSESFTSGDPGDCDLPTCQLATKTCPEFGTTNHCVGQLEALPYDRSMPTLYYPAGSDINLTLQNHYSACAGTFCYWRDWRHDYHKGLDLWAPHGTPIYAALKASVLSGRTEETTPSGLLVMLRSPFTDPRTKTAIHLVHGYMHLQSLAPKIAGAVRAYADVGVERGELIGYAGHTGTPSRPGGAPNACHQEHTHFRVYNDAKGRSEDFDTRYWFTQPAPVWTTVANCPPH